MSIGIYADCKSDIVLFQPVRNLLSNAIMSLPDLCELELGPLVQRLSLQGHVETQSVLVCPPKGHISSRVTLARFWGWQGV